MFILKISNRNGGEIMQKYKDKSLNIEERIDDLLSKMTNEEKVGQMLQVSYNTLSKEDYEKYKNLGIGSFLHVLGDEADDIKKRAEKTRLGYLRYSALTHSRSLSFKRCNSVSVTACNVIKFQSEVNTRYGQGYCQRSCGRRS